MSTPHYGTPLAAFFATVSGQRMLYALSALTFIALTLGSPPLAAASALVLAVGRIDRALGLEIRVLDRATDRLLHVLDEARSREVRAYLDAIAQRPGRHGAAHARGDGPLPGERARPARCPLPVHRVEAPLPSPVKWARQLASPWGALSTTLFAALWGLTSRTDERYPCAAPHAGEEAEAVLASAFGRTPGLRANDGVVPLRSQVHGRVAWAGHADHLDVLGHFAGARTWRRAEDASGDPRTWTGSAAAPGSARPASPR